MEQSERLRQLPKVDDVLRWPALQELVERHGRTVVRDAVRSLLGERRRAVVAAAAGAPGSGAPGETGVDAEIPPLAPDEIARAVEAAARPSLRGVVNATGVVLHTNLGRAPLAARALERVVEVARGYSTLEWDPETGRRGRRDAHAAVLLAELAGAEDALVVNNNAAAVFLALRVLAAGREVIVSRGELVEIGGGFRVPDVMAASGAKLREVGTTNRTYLEDYEKAIGSDTALLLRVHRSNFAVVGFTAEATRDELVTLGRDRGVDVMEDLGSGSFAELDGLRGGGETTVRAAIAAGVDLVLFSGDKLLGGPQAGILVGREDLIRRIRRDPLNRALRPDKMTLAALQATLELYRSGQAEEHVPALRAMAAPAAELRAAADALAARLSAEAPALEAAVVPVVSRVGGGAFPLAELPGWAVAVGGAGPAPAAGAASGAGGGAGTGLGAEEEGAGAERWTGEDDDGDAAQRARDAGGNGEAEEEEPAPADEEDAAGAARWRSPDVLARTLRAQEPPIVARVAGGRVLLDVRTLLPGDEEAIVRACRAACEASRTR